MYRKIRRETRLRGERKKCDFTKVALMIEGLSKKYLRRQSSPDRNHCFNFGKVYKGNKVEHVFKLENQGNDTLEIKKVKPSCGCTVAILSNNTILPGNTGEVHPICRKIFFPTFNQANWHGVSLLCFRIA